MIVKFSDIMFDAYGRIEQPTLFLKTMAGQAIMPITNYYNLKTNFQYNDVSTITFDVADKCIVDDELVENPAYNKICGMRHVEMEPFGPFILMNPKKSDDEVIVTKHCTAYSLEYELNFTFINALDENGGYMFYDTTGIASNSSLMHIVLSYIPNWKLGHVDSAVCSRVREFSTSSENIYSFLMNTVQESYNCLFVFDTKNRIINVYDAADDVRIENLPIYISKENLIKEIQLNELTEDIVTCLGVYGADNLSIIDVNPIGNEKLYNIDYFIELGDVPSPIAKKWNKWKSDVELYQQIYASLHTQVFINQVAYNSQSTLLEELENELETEKSVLSTYQADSSMDFEAEIEASKLKISEIENRIEEQKTILEAAEKELESSIEMQGKIINFCNFERYFEDYELSILRQFFKEGTIQDSTFVATNIATTPDSCRTVKEDEQLVVEINNGDLYRDDEYAKLTADEKNELSLSFDEKKELADIENNLKDYLNKELFTINMGELHIRNKYAYGEDGNVLDEFTDESFALDGTVLNSTISYDSNDDAVATFSVSSPTFNGVEYNTATFVVLGKIEKFRHVSGTSGKGNMSFHIKSGLLTLTCKNTAYQKQETIQQLYNYGKTCIDKLAYPSYEFSISSTNFIFSEQFEKFKDMIELGKSINVEFNDDLFRRPILIGVELDYEDLTSVNLIFSNKFRTNSSEFLLADVIGKTVTTTSNLDASKFSYKAFSNSGIQNEVTQLIESAFDVSKRQIVNAKDQNFLIDGAGVHLRKLEDKVAGTFSPREVRLINNNIAFTNDGWNSVSLAIGEMDLGGGPIMGVVADSLIGKALIGNNLTIEANGIDPVFGNEQITTFRVDGNGAYIANGAMYMEGPETVSGSRNKLAFDPRYGLIAGDSGLFEIGSNGVELKNINEDGTFEADDFGMPKNSSFFLDINSNSAFFRGNIYAENGYFAGTVSAGTIIERNDYEEEFPEGSIGKIEESAEKAKKTAEQALEKANSIQASSGGTTVYKQDTAPTGGVKLGDIWFNTEKNNQISIYNGAEWEVAQLGMDALGNINANQVVVGSDLIAFGATIGGFRIEDDGLYGADGEYETTFRLLPNGQFYGLNIYTDGGGSINYYPGKEGGTTGVLKALPRDSMIIDEDGIFIGRAQGIKGSTALPFSYKGMRILNGEVYFSSLHVGNEKIPTPSAIQIYKTVNEEGYSTSYNGFCPFNNDIETYSVSYGELTLSTETVSYHDRTEQVVYGVKVGGDISAVRVHATVSFQNNDTTSSRSGYIRICRYRPETGSLSAYCLSRFYLPAIEQSRGSAVASALVTVQEGDFIFVTAYKNTAEADIDVITGDHATTMYVEAIH